MVKTFVVFFYIECYILININHFKQSKFKEKLKSTKYKNKILGVSASRYLYEVR